MNIPTPVPITELKEGELYFREVTKKMTSKYYYIIIVKIEKIQLEREPKLITFTYSILENYSVFSEITDFDTVVNYSSDDYDFFETYIQSKNYIIEYCYYNFDEEWFFKNKQKILSYSFCSKNSFLDIFQEIKMGEINECSETNSIGRFERRGIIF